jgi:Na+/melibiose symporter-like transporter
MWVDAPFDSALARFAYYAFAYTLMNLAMSVLTVPYLAIQPEMALEYDARTSLNMYRTLGSMFGVLTAVMLRPVAEGFGGNATGFAAAGALYGVLIAVPWLAVYAATFERQAFRDRQSEASLRDSVLFTFWHRTFMKLTWIYIMGRIAMDLSGTLVVLYVSFWLGRSADFEPTMALFLAGAALAYFAVLPVALKVMFGFQRRSLSPMITADAYFSFATTVVLAFGLIFQLPHVLSLLVYLRIISAQTLVRFRRVAIVINAVLSAFLTPGPDIVSQILMMIPVQLFYELSIVFAKVLERRRARRERTVKDAAAAEA